MPTSAVAQAPASAEVALEVPQRLPVSTLSVSSMRLFWKCPERWRRQYVLGEREPASGALVIGRAGGAALSAFFRGRLEGQELQASEVDDVFVAEFDADAVAALFSEDEPAEKMREQGREAVAAYLDKMAPELRPAAVERRIRMQFPGAGWRFVSYLDVEDERGFVVDVKIRKKHVSGAEADGDPQASTYLVARMMEGRPAKAFVFHSGRRGSIRGDRWIAVETRRSPEQLYAFERRIAQTARAIARCEQSGDWPLSSPEGWWCGPTCPFHASCPGGAGT